MVQELDAEGLTGGFQLSGDGDIVFAGGEVAGGVVVGDDDGGGAVGDGIGKDLAGVHLGFVDQPNGDGSGGDHFVCAV